MDIINILSVVKKVTVHQWVESEDGVVQDALYWRQVFDYLTCQISVCLVPARYLSMTRIYHPATNAWTTACRMDLQMPDPCEPG